MPTSPLDFQSMVFALQSYWAEQGCLISEPYYSQVGAGTMNPSTYLRVLGPEPWRVAYVEPSVRPDDGRYGINPNRLQQHHQFQVILKPDPGNPVELYLKSLEAIGINSREHDIRFVEDNWESPALSAWGLGWEVWLDGQEITQYTYFQQAGGIQLDVPSVEITYGLERIAMTLQKVNHFAKVRWNPERTFGDLFQIPEREHSTYYYEVADVEHMQTLFETFSAEADLALGKGLVLPAYDNVIKTSHVFNIMDARGAIGYTERQALFGRMRDLSRRVAEAYLLQRQELGFPWLKTAQEALEMSAELPAEVMSEKADLLLEIGTEELPTAELESVLEQLDEQLPSLLGELRLSYEAIDVEGTPRRLAMMVRNLRTRQQDRVLEVKGPPADRAYDADGKPTQAAVGFARSKGVGLEALSVRDNYVFLELQERGKSAVELLQERLPAFYRSLKFSKSMRWNDSGDSFSRPVRWLVALLGDTLLRFEFAGLKTDRVTKGLRFSSEPTKILRSTGEYPAYLESQGIILNNITRRETVWGQASNLAAKVGGQLQKDEMLLSEVTNLVERPTALLGSFDPRYLESLPSEVLIAVMKKHQRYFPVLNAEGKLTNHFIILRNGGTEGADLVVDGNLQVILARFADAEFFIREDRQTKLEDFVLKLNQLTFQKKLGSMLDKTKRIEKLVGEMGKELGFTAEEQKTASRAATLAKADLASSMVIEMTALQGIMGRYYAQLSGESQPVAQAVFEHYLPRNAEDMLPESKSGMLVGLADRLDSLAGLFAAGLAPTGNKDPFALRRTALGLCQLLIGKSLSIDVGRFLQLAGAHLPIPFKPETLSECLDFVAGRLKGLLLEDGCRYDVVDAVLKMPSLDPAKAAEYAETLSRWIAREDWMEHLQAYSRCVRITRDLGEQFKVSEVSLIEPEEKELYRVLKQAEAAIEQNPGLETGLQQVSQLNLPITNFFNKVLVMAEDMDLRQSRLGMLQRIAELLSPFADLSALEGF